jgi:hypothetical protein
VRKGRQEVTEEAREPGEMNFSKDKGKNGIKGGGHLWSRDGAG